MTDNNDLLKNRISELQEILKNNEAEKNRLLTEINNGNKEVYKSKKAIVSKLSKELINLLPEGLYKKLLQLKGYSHCYIGGSNVMDYQEKGQLLQALINESIEINPDRDSRMCVSKTYIYASEIYIDSLGIALFGEEPHSIKKIVGEINIIWSHFCKLSVESDGSPDKPSYQCFTIELKQ